MRELQSLLFHLYQYLRCPNGAAMKLTLEQFDLLCEAIEVSDPIDCWDDLKKICCLVWVKPHESASLEQFEHGFECYRKLCQDSIAQFLSNYQLERLGVTDRGNDTLIGEEWPTIPHRQGEEQNDDLPDRTDRAETSEKSPPSLLSAMKGERVDSNEFVLQDLPLSLQQVRESWKTLGRIPQNLPDLELNLEATLDQLQRTGCLIEVLKHQSRQYEAELVLLVDQDNPMIPFGPVLEPFIRAVKEKWITPAQVYRYITVPTQYLYPWDRPAQAVPIRQLLSRMNHFRTIVLIISDAGAASQTMSPSRLMQTGKFLDCLRPCVRDYFWINPMPRQSWQKTTAESAARMLGGRMMGLDIFQLKQAFCGFELESEELKWSLIP